MGYAYLSTSASAQLLIPNGYKRLLNNPVKNRGADRSTFGNNMEFNVWNGCEACPDRYMAVNVNEEISDKTYKGTSTLQILEVSKRYSAGHVAYCQLVTIPMELSQKGYFFLYSTVLMVDWTILTWIPCWHLKATASCHKIMSDALQSKKGYVNFNSTLLLSLSVFIFHYWGTTFGIQLKVYL